MIVTCVHVHVDPDHIEEFIAISKMNHDNSTKEPGNLRFDVLQSAEDPGYFLLYEAYESEEAAAAHKQTQHYATWRDTVAPWMVHPRRGVPYKGIVP